MILPLKILTVVYVLSLLFLEILIDIGYKNQEELISLEDLLAFYYEKNGQRDKHIETYYAKLELMEDYYDK